MRVLGKANTTEDISALTCSGLAVEPGPDKHRPLHLDRAGQEVMHLIVYGAHDEGKQATWLCFCTRCLSSSSFNFGMLAVVKRSFSCNVLQRV